MGDGIVEDGDPKQMRQLGWQVSPRFLFDSHALGAEVVHDGLQDARLEPAGAGEGSEIGRALASREGRKEPAVLSDPGRDQWQWLFRVSESVVPMGKVFGSESRNLLLTEYTSRCMVSNGASSALEANRPSRLISCRSSSVPYVSGVLISSFNC